MNWNQLQLWSQDFTAKLFCNVEFWLERLRKLIEFQAGFEQQVVASSGRILELTQRIAEAE